MFTFVLVAGMVVLGTLIMMGRLNLKRFLGYPNLVDVLFTILMLYLFHDTFSGMGLMVPGRQIPNSRQESARSKQSAHARNPLSASGALAPLGSAVPLSRS